MVTQNHGQTLSAWNAIATGYDKFVTQHNSEVAETALRHIGLVSEMSVLDVASGSGALSIPAARLGAQVLATDLSPTMIDLLTARARSEGLANLEGRVMDGQALELYDDRFDIAASQYGVMLFPDLPRGLREMTRVTKPGGKVMLVVFGPPPTLDFLVTFTGAMKAVVPGFSGLPTDPPPLPFQASNPDVLRRHFADAGLTDIQVERDAAVYRFQTGEQFWNWVTNSNPIAVMMIADLTDEQRSSVIQRLDAMLRERADENGVATLSNEVHICIGTKPVRH